MLPLCSTDFRIIYCDTQVYDNFEILAWFLNSTIILVLCHGIHFNGTVFLRLAKWPLLKLLIFLQCYLKINMWKHPNWIYKRLKGNIIQKHLIFYTSITKYYPSVKNLTDWLLRFLTSKHFHTYTSNHSSLKKKLKTC